MQQHWHKVWNFPLRIGAEVVESRLQDLAAELGGSNPSTFPIRGYCSAVLLHTAFSCIAPVSYET